MFDIAVFAMRARPFGPQHLHNINEALKVAQYVFVMIGSANEPINFRNPFTVDEVKQMVRGSLTHLENDRVYLFGVEDQDSDLKWVAEVQRQVRAEAKRLSLDDPKITLVGHSKDNSGYYLRLFPQWERLNTADWRDGYSSTGIRNTLYKVPGEDVDQRLRLVKEMRLPTGTEVFLRQWIGSDRFFAMQEEFNFNQREAAKFPPHPYHGEGAAFHLTADMCMFQAGGVFLVKRGEAPGKGLWALPGGHINFEERFEDAAVREFIEETSILERNADLTIDDIKVAIRGSKLLDNPWRSTRMRTVGMAYGGILPGQRRLLVRGADDAKEARCWNIDEVTRDMMFEDHYLIIRHFADILNIQ
ncbi:bifunctional NMN adenylyltransferase/nudix hydrolase [Erythrobacter phage vB_EliS-L02]|nr:bifunctional NMN adenylyltransferase/nudix hydrolase [Erythrobacter phage vB_EliS-L02]